MLKITFSANTAMMLVPLFHQMQNKKGPCRSRVLCAFLMTKSKAFNQLFITIEILLAEITKQLAAFPDKGQQALL